jgi:hypothetical protein
MEIQQFSFSLFCSYFYLMVAALDIVKTENNVITTKIYLFKVHFDYFNRPLFLKDDFFVLHSGPYKILATYYVAYKLF